MTAPSINGLIHLSSPRPVPDTLARVASRLQGANMTIFARIDHAAEAEKVGLKMRPCQLLIFGSPTGGTPLMFAAPTLAIDLPLKALAWEDAEGNVWLSYNTPEYLQQRHNFPPELIRNISGVGALLQRALE